nr:hypothetical protein CFP56_12116 [Quercus suber]
MRCNSSYDSPAIVVCSAARQDNTPPRDSFSAERAALNGYSLKSVGIAAQAMTTTPGTFYRRQDDTVHQY